MKCEHCGREFTQQSVTQFYCSRKCAQAHRRQNGGSAKQHFPVITFFCAQCGRRVTTDGVYDMRTKFCCRDCEKRYWRHRYQKKSRRVRQGDRCRGREMQTRGPSANATVEWKFDGGFVASDPEKDRLQVFLNYRPDIETRHRLEHQGFTSAPILGTFQRKLTVGAYEKARELEELAPLDTEEGSNAGV